MRLPTGVSVALLAGALVAFALLVGVAVWNPAGEFWVGVEPPKAQCESYDPAKLASLPRASDELYDPVALRRLFREPQNTVSNFGYLAVGVFVWVRSRRAASRMFATACGFLAFGSGMYHASLLPEWRLIDMMGVYAVLFTLLGVAASEAAAGRTVRPRRGESGEPTHRAAAMSLAVHGAVFLAAVWCAVHRNDFRWWGRFKPLDSTNLVLALIGLLSVAALLALRRASAAGRPRARRLFAALAVFGPLAGAGGQGDRFGGFWADPHALIQGHTVWHVGGAIALVLAHELFVGPPCAPAGAQKTHV